MALPRFQHGSAEASSDDRKGLRQPCKLKADSEEAFPKRARRAELLDMMDAEGLLHFFMTWSSADVQWDELQKVLIEG